MSVKAKVAVLGATGFTGEKLTEILLDHPGVEVTYLASRTPKAVPYHVLFPHFYKKTNLDCEPFSVKEAADRSDVVFLSLPHTVSMEFAAYLLKKKKKVIDLSADYRIKDTSVYKKYYHSSHKDKGNLGEAVYGLAEVYKKAICSAKLIANPGCYSTSIILALFPLLKEGIAEGRIIADSKSSITGAGRKASLDYHYMNISSNIWAYKPFSHQHTPEILGVFKQENVLKNIKFCFVPHVAGVEAGIYSTIYVSFKTKVTRGQIEDIYNKYYKNCPFVRIIEGLPKLKEVAGTNFCDIGFALDNEKKNGVIASSIDNLIKGAAGSAVQNMNIMLGWDETLGLL